VPSYEAYHTGSVLAKAPIHAAEHSAYLWQILPDGALLTIGPFSDPRVGAMGISATRDAAETFADRDPFVLHGIVSR
jgi:uncharacterized protein YciI